ncbi:MAG: aminopeptidase [Candidatus Krumholzibacteriota bacterium]|nr:aminopeptidase [Candidatus Krumholzibacteriota bacterium]
MSLSFDQMLQNYADLAVRIGVGLQPGQRLMLRAPVECAPLTRLVVDKAYQAGARLVEVLWGDEQTTLSRYLHAPRDSFDEIPTAAPDYLLKGSERGDAVLSIYAADPDLLKDQDPGLVAQVQKQAQIYLKPFSRRISSKEINWSIVAAPVTAWARKVFPDQGEDEAAQSLWEAIFRICRADRPDPVAAWNEHLDALKQRRAYLNGKSYAKLHYRAPGTDLTLGMPAGQVWLGGTSHTPGGVAFVANMPTEEVFAAPHRLEAEGTVAATKPLSYAGSLIEGFRLRFAGGKVVEATAEKNEQVLKHLLDTDEGATRLGEVALVPHSSPISASGLLFYNTLYDENASCHLALGRAYRICIDGGETLSDEDFLAAGGNDSLTHVDFMIGSDAMDIDGITPAGDAEPIMRAGEWVFEA